MPAAPARLFDALRKVMFAGQTSNSPCFDCRLAVFKRRFDKAAAG
jgi:hypothetical protein